MVFMLTDFNSKIVKEDNKPKLFKKIPKNLCRILVFMHLWLHAIRLKSSYRKKKSYET